MLFLRTKRKFAWGRWVVAGLWIVGSLAVRCVAQADSSHPDADSYGQRAGLAVESLQAWYDLDSGLYRTTGWWNSANAITVLADYARVTHSSAYDFVFSNTLSRAQKTSPGFINKFYDDEGWWALAWIDVYGVTQDPRYLEAAKSVFADMTYGWDDTCSGGIWWSKDRTYKNAIANELFLSVAAQLALVTKNPQERAVYLAWARREWRWFSRSGMINDKHLVNDGLNAKCENNGKTAWTYNQGVVLGGLSALSRVDRDPSLLTEAGRIAEATLAHLVDAQGILHDRCEPKCGADGTQFKGIFVRNLRALEEVRPRPEYRHFVLANAASLWSQVRPPEYRLGEVWAAPFGAADASSQSSALDVLVTAAGMTASPQRRPARY